MKKRLLSILLCICLLLTMLPTNVWAAEANEADTQASNGNTSDLANPFKDVSESDWFYDFVIYALENGIFSGESPDTFLPNGTMTRGMYVTVMGRIAGVDVSEYSGSAGFTDVTADAWYAPYVLWAMESGITTGSGNGAFLPDAPITREQMAVMLLRYYEAYDIDYGESDSTSQPADLDEVSPWARDAVTKLWRAGIFQGDAAGKFNPKENATRAECATISTRVDKIVTAYYENLDKSEKDPDKKDKVPENPYCYIRYDSNGGTAVAPQLVLPGMTIERMPVTQKEGATFLGWFTDSACTIPFYASEPITTHLVLYAKYAEPEKTERFLDETFTLTDQAPDLSFVIKSSDLGLSADAVESMLTLEIMDHSGYVSLEVTGSDGTYNVSADGGFQEGAAYKLTAGEGLTFEGKTNSFRICTFTIEKNEVINLALSDDLIYIPANQITDIKRNGIPVSSLSVALMGNSGNVTGSFTYANAAQLAVSDMLCVYAGVNPNDRNTNTDYSDSEVAYVQVTSVSGTTVNFTNIDETDAQDVLALPDTLPINTADLAANEDLTDHTFVIANTALNFSAYSTIGLDANTTLDVGDYLVFFTGSIAASTSVSYGKVTNVVSSGGNTTIIFADTTANAIYGTNLDYYTKDDVSGDVILADVDVDALEDQIETQAVESGFAASAMSYLAAVATETDGFKEISGVESLMLTDEKGNAVDPGELSLMGIGFEYENDNVTVTAEISSNTEKFGRGLRCALTLQGEFTVDVGEESEIKINLSATFVEEVKISFNADGKAIWDMWGIFPYIRDYQMNANIDVYNFTGISLQAKVSSAEKDDGLTLIDFTEFDVSEELKKLLGVEDETALDAGVQDLFELYGEMLETETDYISIVDKEIVKQQAWADPFCIIAYSFQVNFVISANINVWLGANFEYMSGTRYNFWFEIRAKQAGSSSMDLMDETYAFQFYVMGTIGIKAGLVFEFAIGLFSTDLASIGLSAEFGAYIELYGYFIYELQSVRQAGQADDVITTNMAGALYLEFGVYLEIRFKAQAINNKFAYNPLLYANKWPLLYAGTQLNVYDFGYKQPEDDEVFFIKDEYDGTTSTLPESYRFMARLDLKEGNLTTAEYPLNKFYYSKTNKNFDFNAATGLITVTVPEGIQYMECDLTLTWKSDKLAFTKGDLTRTVHLVWTNLTPDEQKEKYTVSVKAGNDNDGYTTVWSTRVNKGLIPDLPRPQEVLEYIGYNKSNINNNTLNLKYTGYTGYDVNKPAEKVDGDQVYTFNVTPRKYTLTVNDVQKPDGSTEILTFTAKYGERFDLSALSGSGTRRADSTTYTRYVTTERTDAQGTPIVNGKSADSVIGIDFAIQLLNNTYTYNAKYIDNTSNVTYLFNSLDGIAIDPVTVKVENGSIPSFDYSTYLLNTGVGYIAKSWSTPIGKVYGDTVFTAVCGTPEGDPFTITFDSTTGSAVAPMIRYPGAAISAPAEPTRVGYTFAGWYTDEALTAEYAFTHMPNESFVLYAKWTPHQYTVTFNPGAGDCSPASKSVTYGEPYGTLPTPTRSGYGFISWTTPSDYVIEASATVYILQDLTLYANWYEKQSVASPVTDTQTYTYDKTAKSFVLNFIPDSDLTGYQVQYKRNGADSYSDYAVSASTYTVKITRSEDETYKKYELALNGALVINRAVRDVTVDPPTFRSSTFSAITVNPVTVPNNDGTMMYAASTSNTPPASGWTTSTTIGGLNQNTQYYVFAKVAGGENYLDAYSTGVSMQTGARASISTTVYWFIKTADVYGAGTDANVGGKILFADGSETGRYLFNLEGNDFERNDYDRYDTAFARDPWMISGINIGNDGAGAGSAWNCAYVWLGLYNQFSYQFSVNKEFNNSYSDYYDDSHLYRRSVTGAGNFDTWGGEHTITGSSSGTISYTYDGTITNPYYGTYNAYDHDDAPTITVTPNLTEYGHCYFYSNYDFTVDEAALYAKMSELSDNQIVFTITLSFPTRSTTADTATITKTITINRN